MPNERRRSQAENRAVKRFLAMMTERYPTIARLGYPVSGDEKIVYIKTLIPVRMEKEVFAFAAGLTGVISEQEGIKVLLINEDPITEPELSSDDELKGMQQTITSQVVVLRKLRAFNDQEANQQRTEYLARVEANYEAILKYLVAQPE